MTADAVVNVLVVDDHQLLAQTMALALRAEGIGAEVAELGSREDLIERVQKETPDLVMLDLDLGGDIGDGSTLVRPFVQAGSKVLVVSGSTKEGWVGAAVEQGAVGVVMKSAPFDELLTTTMQAARGYEVLPDEVRQRMLNDLRSNRERDKHDREPYERLTSREQQVLHELSNGKTVAAIAAEWVVSEATVRTQVRGVLMKLGASSQLEAVARAMRAGWLTS